MQSSVIDQLHKTPSARHIESPCLFSGRLFRDEDSHLPTTDKKERINFPIQTYVSEFWHQSYFFSFALGTSTSNQAFSTPKLFLGMLNIFSGRMTPISVEGYLVSGVVQELRPMAQRGPSFPGRLSLVSASDSAHKSTNYQKAERITSVNHRILYILRADQDGTR